MLSMLHYSSQYFKCYIIKSQSLNCPKPILGGKRSLFQYREIFFSCIIKNCLYLLDDIVCTHHAILPAANDQLFAVLSGV